MMNITIINKVDDIEILTVADNDNKHSNDDNDTQQIVYAKLTAIIVLFVASSIFGYIPFKLSDWFQWNINPSTSTSSSSSTAAASTKIVTLLLSIGGGVLLCTTFLHLLPEINESIEQLKNDKILTNYNFHLAELLMCCGFFVMYLIDELIHIWLHHRQHHQSTNQPSSAPTPINSIDNNAQPATISINDFQKNADNLDNEKFNNQQNVDAPVAGHSHLQPSDAIHSSLRGLLIVLALSIHELFEGLAIGLEHSVGNVWYMFAAVAAHKLVISFCIGIELITTKIIRWLAMIYVFTFAIVSPIGIGIGILVSNDHGTNDTRLIATILQGIACGTLLYVVFFEILQKNRQTGGNGFAGLMQWFAVLLGFFIMFGFQFIGGHEHSHGGHDDHDHDDINQQITKSDYK